VSAAVKNGFTLTLNSWDTGFFNRKIGSLDYAGNLNVSRAILTAQLKNTILQAEKLGYKYLVLTDDKGRGKLRDVMLYMGFEVCDTAVDLKMRLSAEKINGLGDDKNSSVNAGFADSSELKGLRSLSESAFIKSRFYKIKFAKKKDVGRYHYNWVVNLFENRNSRVITAKNGNKVMGFLGFVLDRAKKTSRIALIATKASSRGKGYGTALLRAYFKYVYKKGIKTLYVKTQRENKGARNFYRKNGYKEFSFEEKYHLYLPIR
jgi:ribosomal protein S18 acetylase RimI-like enzyme